MYLWGVFKYCSWIDTVGLWHATHGAHFFNLWTRSWTFLYHGFSIACSISLIRFYVRSRCRILHERKPDDARQRPSASPESASSSSRLGQLHGPVHAYRVSRRSHIFVATCRSLEDIFEVWNDYKHSAWLNLNNMERTTLLAAILIAIVSKLLRCPNRSFLDKHLMLFYQLIQALTSTHFWRSHLPFLESGVWENEKYMMQDAEPSTLFVPTRYHCALLIYLTSRVTWVAAFCSGEFNKSQGNAFSN